MTVVRPLERADLQPVANLLVKTFQQRPQASAEMASYLGQLLLDLPDRDPEINSLVHVNDNGQINGFIGVFTQLMQIDGRTLRAALGNSLAVDPDAGDPMVGARLCRGFFKGPQDITISDRSNATSVGMWRGMGGSSLPTYSMDWHRTLRPVSSATSRIRGRLKLRGVTAPITSALDGVVERYAKKRGKEQWITPTLPQRPPGLTRRDASDADLLAAIPALVAASRLHPVWSEAGLQTLLTHSARKSEFGDTIRQVIADKSGRVIGAYIYYLQPHGFAQVLHVFAAKGMAEAVLDILLVDASERGAVAIGGRAQAALLEPLMDRHAALTGEYRCVFGTTDKAVLEAVQTGDAIIGGIVGEFWARINGDNLK
ncbi:hypothetical protein [Devosia sp. 2618]|uniref:hypothetical protein n=1 Tax=Devosia sp. 2618 TaxID=3156454 RepID=UPI00339252A5